MKNPLYRKSLLISGADRIWLALATLVLIGMAPCSVLHAQVNGTTSGTTITQVQGDDTFTVTSIGVSYFTYCPWIPAAVANDGFNAYNFVFAGQGVASGIANIASSDFTISSYSPWIGNSNTNANGNGIVGPDGHNYNRNVVNGEQVGQNIVITYRPTAGSDPTSINFMQAYVLGYNGNGGPHGVYTNVDNGGRGGPFYNENGAGGVGTNALNNIPLVTSSNSPGWLLDIPTIPEFGYANEGDDTITNAADYFQTFISSQQNIGGTNYNVLYGGVQWGFNFSSVDVVPEPQVLALAGAGALFFLASRFRRS